MTPIGFLNPEDLRRLTGRARANGQEEWLKAEGIPHKRQGSDMLVMWAHVQAWIEAIRSGICGVSYTLSVIVQVVAGVRRPFLP